jgi:hypothetical protein
MIIYIDDSPIIKSEEGIEKVIPGLKNHDYGLKIEEDIKDYLSCCIKVTKEIGIAWIMEANLINNLEAVFGDETKTL